MGMQSTVCGVIRTCTGRKPEEWQARQLDNERALAAFPYDERYPFTDIFWAHSPAQYQTPVIGFAGSYKQIEEHWSEWLWKFSQLLSTLDANDAFVYLHCIRGSFAWRLQPLSFHLAVNGISDRNSSFAYRGEEWGIVEAPADDFTLTPYIGDNQYIFNDARGKVGLPPLFLTLR
jgi:hypothetical protein